MGIRLTQTVKIFIFVSFVAFILQQTGDQFFGTHLMAQFALVPTLFFGQHRYWQLFTNSLMHADVSQLFFEMLTLAFIGSEIELIWGMKRFVQYGLFCLLASSLFYLGIFAGFGGRVSMSPLLGASPVIYGLLVAYGLMFGERTLLFMWLFPMKAKHFVWVLAGLVLMTTIFSSGGGLTGLSQLAAMLFGFFYLWGRTLLNRGHRQGKGKRSAGGIGQLFKSIFSKKRRPSKHLKLVVDNDRDLEGELDGMQGPEDDTDHKPKIWH